MKKSDQNEEKTRADSDLDPDDTTPWDTLWWRLHKEYPLTFEQYEWIDDEETSIDEDEEDNYFSRFYENHGYP